MQLWKLRGSARTRICRTLIDEAAFSPPLPLPFAPASLPASSPLPLAAAFLSPPLALFFGAIGLVSDLPRANTPADQIRFTNKRVFSRSGSRGECYVERFPVRCEGGADA